ncbi:uncharacterized protein ARMOST_16270 [Armillaria ostoyae]|uniref:Beta-lactamase-related domain-containing protein n=1 Tax=Armillaria ostoyae TaxID=47428 RepID=A0A284RVQ3_ARMOS|nr:uncharacterized protein ARMOST_16270 [Armillaria ostoyae]
MRYTPSYPGAAVMIGHQGTIVSRFAVGEVVKYANDNDSEFENVKKISAKLDTIYNMASVAVAISQLLTHTAGFDADPAPPLWTGYTSYSARRQAIIRQGLLNQLGTTYLHPDLSFMMIQLVLEIVTGLTLGILLERDFTGPLGMTDTFFNRGNLVLDTSRIAATEFQIAVQGTSKPQRSQPVWGTVRTFSFP